MYRLYTADEIQQHFGDRGYFKEMTRDQIKHVVQYLAKMCQKDASSLEEAILKEGLCEVSDSEVYKTVQALSPSISMFNKDYFKKTTEKIAHLYRKMCKYNKFNFKQRIGDVLDIGQDDPAYLQMLKKDMYARFVNGIGLDKNIVDSSDGILVKLSKIRDGSVDIVVCNSSLHSIDERLLGSVYDNLARITSRYIILKDYALGENFHLMKEMAIQRELASGIVIPSIIPDMIAQDTEGILDPSQFYNMEFSIEHAVRYLKERDFQVVYEPPMPKSMGNVRIYVLKRDSFIPMSVDANRSGLWGQKGDVGRTEGVQDLRDKLRQQGAHLCKKAIAQPTRDKHQREVTTMLNKLSASNYTTIGADICASVASFLIHAREGNAAVLEEFFVNVTDRLFNRARTCRLTPDIFAAIYQDITTVELVQMGYSIDTSRVYILMQERCMQFIRRFFSLNVAQTDPDLIQEMRCHMECLARFIAHARLRSAIDTDIYNMIVKQFIEYIIPYPEILINLLEQLQTSPLGRLIAQPPSQLLIISLKTMKQQRPRCLILNYLETFRIEEQN